MKKRCLNQCEEQSEEDDTNAHPDYVNSSSDESVNESDVMNYDSVAKAKTVSWHSDKLSFLC
jgi:hypothetical protein